MTDQIKITPQKGPQAKFAKCTADVCLYGGAAGGGKALDPNTKVLTPTGSTLIKDIKVGDKVLNPDGGSCKVTGVFPNQNSYMYKVTFEDDTTIIACKDHQWVVFDRFRNGGRAKDIKNNPCNPVDPLALVHPGATILKTLQLIPLVEKSYAPQVPVNRPVSFTTTYMEKERIINTYSVGALILRPNLETKRMWKFLSGTPGDMRPTGAEAIEFCRQAKLLGKPIPNREIPGYIRRGSVEERLEFVQGVMDRHARLTANVGIVCITVDAHGIFSEHLMDILRSLGCICKAQESADGRSLIKVHISPFIEPFKYNENAKERFKPNTAALGKSIKSVEPLHTSYAICISVDHPNRLYMVDNYTVTHNTYGLLMEFLKWKDIPSYRAVIFRRKGTEITQSGGLWDESETIYNHFGGIPVKGAKRWDWNNKSKVEMLHLEHDKTLEERKGVQAPLIMFDELSTFTERMFFYMLSRNRNSLGVPSYIRATTNPVPRSDPTGGWIRDFIDWWLDDAGYPIPERSGVVRHFWRWNNLVNWADTAEELIEKFGPVYGYDNVLPKSFTFISAKVDDNTYMPKEYKAGLVQGNRADREALLDGCWDVVIDAGTYFSREWVTLYQNITEPVSWVRYWDRAASVPTEEYPDPDWTVGVLMGRGKESNRLYIDDVVRFRKGPSDGRKAIREIAIADRDKLGRHKICIERDPGAAGVIEAKSMTTYLREFQVYARPTGNKDKLTRFAPFSAAAQDGEVYIKEAQWNNPYFEELERFVGNGKGKDDQADATSGAYAEHIDPVLQLGKIILPEFRK